jgi:hypothetical protein
MKFTLFIVLFTMLSFSASAQWYYRIGLKKGTRYPAIAQPKNNSVKRIALNKALSTSKISQFTFPSQSDYDLELAEAAVMKTAQHNMRFRIYDEASYNFSELAQLYIKQNRFSEAKWYLLQSNTISRQENDDKHTISNLMVLAMVKANLGDLVQAQQDLDEAHQMAVLRGWTTDVTTIENETKYIKLNKTSSSPKLELRYASDAMVTDKKVADKKTD